MERLNITYSVGISQNLKFHRAVPAESFPAFDILRKRNHSHFGQPALESVARVDGSNPHPLT